MRHWNYRVVEVDFFGEKTYHIFEIYYGKNGKIEAWAGSDNGEGQLGIAGMGESIDELKSDLNLMLEALDEEPLIYEDLEKIAQSRGGE